MSKTSAAFCVIFIVALVVSFFIPKGPEPLKSAFDNYAVVSRNDVGYTALREEVALPAELPMNYTFDKSESYRAFYAHIQPSRKSGYYSKGFTLYLDCDFDLYYTLDGTLPDNDSLKYNPLIGINITETAFLCVSAEYNGEFSDVSMYSYVIFKDACDYKYGYAYNSLDATEKTVYERLYRGISAFEREIYIGNYDLSINEVTNILFCVNYDNPLLFQTPYMLSRKSGSKDNVLSVTMGYDFTSSECMMYEKNFLEYVDEAMESADGSESLMDYLHAIHNHIILSGDYCEDEDCVGAYEAFGVTALGEGVCESYSRAFQYICKRMGLECILVVGISEDISHMWNMIEIEGEWYHMDLTWDDGGGKQIYYDYFNVDEETIKRIGLRDISPLIRSNQHETAYEIYNYYPIPEANSSKYNFMQYFYY